MLKIGDFSKICQTSIKAMRHWDAIGLLKPALTDMETNYRYYSIDQIDDVNRILALRSMGLSLNEIGRLLREKPEPDDLRTMLLARRQALHEQIQEAETMIKALDGRLRMIDSTRYEVAVKPIEAVPMLSVRTTVSDLNALVNLLEETHPYSRLRDNTNLLAVFHDEGYEVEALDVEVGFPVESTTVKPIPLKHNLHMQPTVLPAYSSVASTIHRGELLTLPQAYIHLGRWIEQNDYVICGAGRELFHHIDWSGNQYATVTELQFPVQRRVTAEP